MRQVALLLVALTIVGCESGPQAESWSSQREPVSTAIEATMADARRAIDTHGVTDKAMSQIQEALSRLAQTPGLMERAELRELHDSAAMGVDMLASESTDGICLYLVRFAPNTETPVHDHLTWGVVHVLEGQDRYVRWNRLDDGEVSDHATLRVAEERTMGPGDSTYWLPPPHDIHSQGAVGEAIWELVMTGRDVTHASVTDHRHYFDPDTGRVSHDPTESK
jgi:predicted metal-dependent enzyme (double-stranded beta helix superfamily)